MLEEWPSSKEINAAAAERITLLLDECGGLVGDLARRTMRLAQLGRLRRQYADLNQAWYKNEALDGDPEACLHTGCH